MPVGVLTKPRPTRGQPGPGVPGRDRHTATNHHARYLAHKYPPFCADGGLVVIKTQLSISGRCARQQPVGRNR
jgi:hypothetical protein